MKRKRFLSLVLVAAMVMALILPTGLPVYAASEAESYIFDISEGNITVSADTGGTLKVAYGSSLTKDNITTSQVITIIGTTITNKVVVDSVAANIMLDEVKIQLTTDDACAFKLKNNANVTLGLKEGTSSILKSGRYQAGLGVSSGQILNIIGPGALAATGGPHGAGIGGGSGGAGGTISISGGTVTATARNSEAAVAGVGGGSSGAGGNISIYQPAIVKAVSNGEKPAIHTDSGTLLSESTAKVLMANFESLQNLSTNISIYVKDTHSLYTSFAPTVYYRSIAFTVLPNNTYQLKTANELQMHLGGSTDFNVGEASMTTFNNVKMATDPLKVAADQEELLETAIKGGNTDLANITSALTNPLPSMGSNGSAISWESNTPKVVSGDGQTVVRPAYGAGNATVTLTATLTKGTVTDTKAFELTVLAETVNPDLAKVAADKIELTDTAIKGTNTNLANITSALTNPLPTVGSNGSTITWVSNEPEVVSHNGQTVVRPAYGAGNATVTLTATLAKGAVTDTKVFPLIVLAETEEPIDPDQAKVAADKAALTEEAIKGANTDLANITGALTNPLPSVGSNGSVVTWVSNTPAVVSHDGQTVVRPAYGAGNTAVTLTATLAKGAVTDTKVFRLTVLATATPSSGGGGGSSSGTSSTTTAVQPKTSVDIIVNGIAVDLGTATDTVEEGKKTTTVTIDEAQLALKENNEIVTISSNTVSDVLRVELTGQMLKTMETKEAVVEIKTAKASYKLPVKQINMDAIVAQVAKDMDLKDIDLKVIDLKGIKVSIEIAKPTAKTIKMVENAAIKGDFIIVVPPVEFNISYTYGDKTVEVKQFNSYVERTIAIPAGIDPSKITTGVVVDQDGTVRHVPTKIIQVEGKYYAKINSLTNSIYAVVAKAMAFSDVESHFAKEAINDIASRLVISGVGGNKFDPDRAITRGEFAAIMVGALGLKPGTGLNAFDDVKASDWYLASIETAAAYNLISGYGDGRFGPKDKITREQAITMIARAMNTTGLKVDIEQEEMQELLTAFGDAAQASDYAKMSIATCIKAGVINSTEGNMDRVKDYITRAEVAVIVRRLLQKSNLI